MSLYITRSKRRENGFNLVIDNLNLHVSYLWLIIAWDHIYTLLEFMWIPSERIRGININKIVSNFMLKDLLKDLCSPPI